MLNTPRISRNLMGRILAALIIHSCFWVLALTAVLMIMPRDTESSKITTTKSFFDEVQGDLTKVTWAHAANSHAKLQSALDNDSIMMIEADVLMGKKEGAGDELPIMAHPPDVTSDLTFDEFLKNVYEANKNKNKKGIKLDFKDVHSMEPVLKKLYKNKKRNKFPIWINADIFRGPVNASPPKISPETFLNAVKNYSSSVTLSIGWTTQLGNDSSTAGESANQSSKFGKYTKEQVAEALKFLSHASIDASLTDTEVTFPVRAVMAAQSIDEMVELVSKAGPHTSLTLWAANEDPIDIRAINRLITQVGKGKVFVDLPFSLDPSSDSSSSTPPSTSTAKVPENPSGGRSSKDKSKKNKDKVITVDDNEFDPSSNSSVHVNAAPNSLTTSTVLILASVLVALLVVIS